MVRTCKKYYWAVVGPGDDQPDMFFAHEEWARNSLLEATEDTPEIRAFIRVFRVRVTYEIIERD